MTNIKIIQTPNERCSDRVVCSIKKRIAFIGGWLLLQCTTSTHWDHQQHTSTQQHYRLQATHRSSLLREHFIRNNTPFTWVECRFFTLILIPMPGMVLGQIGDKCLKLLAFFMTIMRGSPSEGIVEHFPPCLHYHPYITVCILCEDMFVRHAVISFL